MLAGNREFVATHPVATKRVMRAILTATDLCAADPAGIARRLADGGRVPRADDAGQTLADNNYKWREFDPEDTIRWYALRMRETKSTVAVAKMLLLIQRYNLIPLDGGVRPRAFFRLRVGPPRAFFEK